MKQLEVQIMGQSYLLGCPENGDERLLMAVDKVDQAMCKIRDAGKIKARDRIAVLAALNLAFELSDRPVQAQQSILASTDQNAIEGGERVRALLDRLDAALGTDGHLL